MILPDANILVYAMREDAPRHDEYKCWLDARVASREPFGVADIVLSGTLRVLTHPRVFDPPTPLEPAMLFVETLRNASNCVVVNPGPHHWEIFTRLCTSSAARGNLIPDAFLAALAIESGCEWITTDRDFSRFRGLRWRHPLEVEV